MQIDGFKVDGIANIEHAHLRIENLCALIAPNGYGKSNVLKYTQGTGTCLTKGK